MVGEEVDFIDVEDTVVGFSKESGTVGGFALGEDGFQVEGTDNTVFGGTDGKVDEWGITKEGCNWSWPTTAENGYLAAIMSDM